MVVNEELILLPGTSSDVDKPQKRPHDDSTVSRNALLESIRQTRITEKTHIVPLIPVITISGCTFGRTGDFCIVSGQRKAGKTTILQFMVATAIVAFVTDELTRPDTLSIVSNFCQGKDVVIVDTEGSSEDTKDFLQGVLRIAGLTSAPPNLHIYNWREYSQKECRANMDVLFEIHPDPHLIIIDGIADLVSKPNDEQESNEAVRWIMRSASKLNTCFVLVIHENPKVNGQESKLRGHLGSELERKTSAAITIEKDKSNGDHFIRSRFLRKSADFEPITFKWDKELGRPISRIVSPAERELLANGKLLRHRELTALRNRCFYQTDQLSGKELKARLKTYQPASPTTEAARKAAERNIEYLVKDGLIEVFDIDEKPYYRSVTEDALPTQISETISTDERTDKKSDGSNV